MSRVISLDGAGWQVSGHVGVDAAERAAGKPTSDRDSFLAWSSPWVPASVPGSVVTDLWRAGQVPDPYVERNSLLVEWVPQRAWLYRRTLAVPPTADAEDAWLEFDGLDHSGSVFLDGELVGRHDGMFTPFAFEVGDRLRAGGEHLLAVVVEPAPVTEPQAGRTSRVRVHKSRMTYGWDFCARMVHQGIWQSARLRIGRARITDVWARPVLADSFDRAAVHVEVQLDGDAEGVRLEAVLRDDRTTVAKEFTDGRGLDLELPGPRLWWPNGHGQPATYRLTVHARDGDDVVAEADVPVGFRRIEVVPNEGARPDARPYSFVVNGRRTYVNGWNWVPIDVQYGVPRPDKLDHLLRLAVRANANLLRVWGGGLIETEPFYDACDRLGIMVWQEFIQSSSGIEDTPSDDPEFVGLMRREAEAIVPLRRNHPSLALWCGGNELQDERGPLEDERSPVLATVHEVVERLDPGRAWLPTSPTGPYFMNSLDNIAAHPEELDDVHGLWEHQGLERQYELYNRATSLFHSEFGTEGMTNRRTHERLIGPERRWPPTRANPVYRHLGDWWINEPLLQRAFGGRLRDLELMRRASQWLQAEGLRYAVEADRRRAFHNSGSIPWQFNEPYPFAWCTTAVDYRGDPKPAYHAVARAYQPLVVAAAFDRAAWAGHERFSAGILGWSTVESLDAVSVEARLLTLEGARIASAAWTRDLPAGAARKFGDLRFRLSTLPDDAVLFLLDLALEAAPGERTTARYLFSRGDDFAPLLDLEAATVDVALDRSGDTWRLDLRHRRGPAALGLVIEDDRAYDDAGWAEVSDSLVDLLPGEQRTITVDWAGASADPRSLRLSGWNLGPIILG